MIFYHTEISAVTCTKIILGKIYIHVYVEEHLLMVSFLFFFIQTEYFQDDIFPDTKVTYEPVMSSTEWLSGANTPAKTISLKPKDMKLCKFFLSPIFSFILN